MRVAPWAVVLLVLLSSALVGCIHTNDPDEVEIIDEQTAHAYSIVAPIDTGINVYHNHFVLNETLPDWMLDGLGAVSYTHLRAHET